MLKHRLILTVDKCLAIVLGCELICVSMRRLLTRHGWSSILRSHFMGGTELISSNETKNGEGGIRTHEGVTPTRFRVVRDQPDSATSPRASSALMDFRTSPLRGPRFVWQPNDEDALLLQ